MSHLKQPCPAGDYDDEVYDVSRLSLFLDDLFAVT